jgi:hypothetical protein
MVAPGSSVCELWVSEMLCADNETVNAAKNNSSKTFFIAFILVVIIIKIRAKVQQILHFHILKILKNGLVIENLWTCNHYFSNFVIQITIKYNI